MIFAFLQIYRVYQNERICNNPAEGTKIFTVFPISLVTLIHYLATHEHVEQPHRVIRNIVHY